MRALARVREFNSSGLPIARRFPIIWGPEAGRFGCGDGLPRCRLVWSINITRTGKRGGGLGAAPSGGTP